MINADPAAKMAVLTKTKEPRYESYKEENLSLRCPEEEIATLIAQAKTDFDGIFASL